MADQMADQNESNEKESPKSPSVLTIIFNSPGSAEFRLDNKNVTPAQMLAAAAWLDWYARHAFDVQALVQMQVQQQQQALAQKILRSH